MPLKNVVSFACKNEKQIRNKLIQDGIVKTLFNLSTKQLGKDDIILRVKTEKYRIFSTRISKTVLLQYGNSGKRKKSGTPEEYA